MKQFYWWQLKQYALSVFMFYMFLWNNECVLFLKNNSGYSVANFSDIFMVLYELIVLDLF